MSAAVGDVRGGCDIAAAGARGGNDWRHERQRNPGNVSSGLWSWLLSLLLSRQLRRLGLPGLALDSRPGAGMQKSQRLACLGPRGCWAAPGRAASPLWSTRVQLTTH